MRKIFDVRCTSCNTVFEEFGYADDTYRCECGGDAKRIISPVKCSLEGASGDFPGAAMKWERDHNRKTINGGQH